VILIWSESKKRTNKIHFESNKFFFRKQAEIHALKFTPTKETMPLSSCIENPKLRFLGKAELSSCRSSHAKGGSASGTTSE